MVEGEEVLFRPVLRGMFHSDRLLDGSIDLHHVMLCNEAIDVERENDRRSVVAERMRAQASTRRP